MKYDIAALKRKMLVKYPFFGSVVASVDYKENKDIPTAGTDGETIYYNPKYLESLSVEEQTFIFAHEVCHIAFNHILRSEGKDPELWNIATDGVINQFLKRDGLKMALGGVDMAEAINYDAEQLYDKLLQEKQQRQQQNGQGNNQSEQGNQQQNQQQSSGSSQGAVVVVKAKMVNNNLNHNNKLAIHKIKKTRNKIVMQDKVEMNSNNLNNKIVLIVEIHKNKISNPKNKAVVTLGKIYKKKINQSKMLDMILIVCGSKRLKSTKSTKKNLIKKRAY